MRPNPKISAMTSNIITYLGNDYTFILPPSRIAGKEEGEETIARGRWLVLASKRRGRKSSTFTLGIQKC